MRSAEAVADRAGRVPELNAGKLAQDDEQGNHKDEVADSRCVLAEKQQDDGNDGKRAADQLQTKGRGLLALGRA